VHFVWIMGADNLRSFHRWDNWRAIADLVPIAVVDRLGPSLYASASAAGNALAFARIPESEAMTLPTRRPPAWVFLHGLKSPLSSTALREKRQSQAHHPSAAQSSLRAGIARGGDGAASKAEGSGGVAGQAQARSDGVGGRDADAAWERPAESNEPDRARGGERNLRGGTRGG
jgi:nicotinate-nucleotide adenylyltransferase